MKNQAINERRKEIIADSSKIFLQGTNPHPSTIIEAYMRSSASTLQDWIPGSNTDKRPQPNIDQKWKKPKHNATTDTEEGCRNFNRNRPNALTL